MRKVVCECCFMIRRSGLARLVGVGTKLAAILAAIEYHTETRQVHRCNGILVQKRWIFTSTPSRR